MMNCKTKKEPNVLVCISIKGCPEINIFNTQIVKQIGVQGSKKNQKLCTSKSIKKNIFDSFIKPYVDNGTLLWGGATK